VVDLTRTVFRVLLPISFVFAIVLIGLGVVDSLSGGIAVTGVDGAQHTIALARSPARRRSRNWAPTAAAFLNANSAHPFENPNAWTNIIEIFLLLVIRSA